MDGVIVVAFGPRAATRAAVDRARRYGAPITVVAAHEEARRGSRSLRSPLVGVADALGVEGVRAACDARPADDVLLVLHDDVLLHADAAQRLAAAAARDGRVAVPSSNEPDGADHVEGLTADVLPPLRDLADTTATRFRLSCLAATVDGVRSLLPSRLTTAHAVVALAEGQATLVRAAVAVHLDDCKLQQLPPVGPDGRPLLVAALIVRDEEEYLDDCLASLTGLVDRIEVCDTGSTDRTIEIARAHGAGVVERAWRDDFAAARNEVLAQCRDAWWVLSIDADERVAEADVDGFRRRLATTVHDPAGISIPLVDLDHGDGDVTTDHVQRVFPSSAVFHGRVHEVPRRADGAPFSWQVDPGVRLHHLGYRPEVVAARGKADRNVALARAQHAADDDAASAYQLARSLRMEHTDAQLPAEAEQLLLRVADEVRAGTDGLNPRARADALVTLADHAAGAGDDEAAFALAEEALAHDVRDAAAHERHARHGVALGRFDDVLAVAATRDGEVLPGAFDRPWLAVEHAVHVAKARLAVHDVERARQVVLEALAQPVPVGFEGWLDLVSLVALVAPAEADELLRPSAEAALDAAPLTAVTQTFHIQDAAEFCTAVAVATADRPGADVRGMVALAAAVSGDRIDLASELLAQQGLVPRYYVARMARHARSQGREELATTLAARASRTRTPG